MGVFIDNFRKANESLTEQFCEKLESIEVAAAMFGYDCNSIGYLNILSKYNKYSIIVQAEEEIIRIYLMDKNVDIEGFEEDLSWKKGLSWEEGLSLIEKLL